MEEVYLFKSYTHHSIMNRRYIRLIKKNRRVISYNNHLNIPYTHYIPSCIYPDTIGHRRVSYDPPIVDGYSIKLQSKDGNSYLSLYSGYGSKVVDGHRVEVGDACRDDIDVYDHMICVHSGSGEVYICVLPVDDVSYIPVCSTMDECIEYEVDVVSYVSISKCVDNCYAPSAYLAFEWLHRVMRGVLGSLDSWICIVSGGEDGYDINGWIIVHLKRLKLMIDTIIRHTWSTIKMNETMQVSSLDVMLDVLRDDIPSCNDRSGILNILRGLVVARDRFENKKGSPDIRLKDNKDMYIKILDIFKDRYAQLEKKIEEWKLRMKQAESIGEEKYLYDLVYYKKLCNSIKSFIDIVLPSQTYQSLKRASKYPSQGTPDSVLGIGDYRLKEYSNMSVSFIREVGCQSAYNKKIEHKMKNKLDDHLVMFDDCFLYECDASNQVVRVSISEKNQDNLKDGVVFFPKYMVKQKQRSVRATYSVLPNYMAILEFDKKSGDKLLVVYNIGDKEDVGISTIYNERLTDLMNISSLQLVEESPIIDALVDNVEEWDAILRFTKNKKLVMMLVQSETELFILNIVSFHMTNGENRGVSYEYWNKIEVKYRDMKVLSYKNDTSIISTSRNVVCILICDMNGCVHVFKSSHNSISKYGRYRVDRCIREGVKMRYDLCRDRLLFYYYPHLYDGLKHKYDDRKDRYRKIVTVSGKLYI